MLKVRLRDMLGIALCELIVLSGWMPTLVAAVAAGIFLKMQTLLLIGNLHSHDTVM